MFKKRDYLPSDENFLYSTWLKALYYGNEYFLCVPKGIFFRNYHQVIENILKRPNVKIECVCLEEDQDVLLSYAVYEGDVLHWVFTKAPWRKMGLAKMLIPDDIKYVSSLTLVGKMTKPYKWKFNPFLI